MRKPRAIIFDDEVFILNMLKDFFLMRGYEVLSYSDPTAICRNYGNGGDTCGSDQSCSDIMVTDFQMPGLNSLELLEFQARKGRKMDRRNTSIISSYLDDRSRQRVSELGCNVLQKPFTLSALSEWLDACEKRLDFGRPLATRRKEERFESHREVTFSISSTDLLMTGVAVDMSTSVLSPKIPAPSGERIPSSSLPVISTPVSRRPSAG